MVGLVIPLFLTKFIDSIIANLKETTKNVDTVVCFVNDGKPDVAAHFENITLPPNMHVIHRESNGGFATANNSGWNYLLQMYPNIEYLGTLNDDTIPKENWLLEMVKSIEAEDIIAAAVPNVREFPGGVETDTYATFKYGNDFMNPMTVLDRKVDVDTYTKAMSGCCFIAKTKYLKEVDFFDDRYLNGCEDVDLSLKFLVEGYKIISSAKSTIAHLGGSSRMAKPDIGANIQHSMNLIYLKWGQDFDYYNKE